MPCRNHPDVNESLVRCTRCGRQFCRNCVIQLRGFYYCGGCKGEHVRDVQSGMTPGSLDLATVGRRWAGIFLDNLALYAMFIPLIFGGVFALGAVGLLNDGRGGEEVVGVGLIILFYGFALGAPVVYEALMVQSRGQTLGKIAVGIKVVNPDGSDVSPGQAWGRAVAKMALGSCAGLTFLPALFTKDKTTIHDMVAKTRVVRIQR